jgi:hypothetical protein
MELSPSWDATSCAAAQELPNIVWNQKVHYRVDPTEIMGRFQYVYISYQKLILEIGLLEAF